jgi:hypothetical protein
MVVANVLGARHQHLEAIAPAADQWPADGLEAVAACPVWASTGRRVLHDGLDDRVFASAPGTWCLQGCTGCSSAYLDPRPTPATLPIAYRRYCTHAQDRERAANGRAGFVRKAANGYRSFELGPDRAPRSRIGAKLFAMLPWVPEFLGSEVRVLVPPPPGANRLPDVDCGSGTFVAIARELGFEARGIDIDPDALANAGANASTARSARSARSAT